MHNINLTVILKFAIICLNKIILYSIVVIGTVIAVACWTYDSVVFPKFVITLIAANKLTKVLNSIIKYQNMLQEQDCVTHDMGKVNRCNRIL